MSNIYYAVIKRGCGVFLFLSHGTVAVHCVREEAEKETVGFLDYTIEEGGKKHSFITRPVCIKELQVCHRRS